MEETGLGILPVATIYGGGGECGGAHGFHQPTSIQPEPPDGCLKPNLREWEPEVMEKVWEAEVINKKSGGGGCRQD